MSQIRLRGNSYQVTVYAGLDPVSGKRRYLTDSSTDLAEAKRIRTKFRAEVDAQRNARTAASLSYVIEEWLKDHDVEESTKDGYRLYLRLHVNRPLSRGQRPLGEVPVGRLSARDLEQFYARLRRCGKQCEGATFTEHRVDGPHECRVVKHRRPPGRPPAAGHPPHDCAKTGCEVLECKPHKCNPMSNATILKIHFMISGALSAGVRWDWIPSNVADVAKKPPQPVPDPRPPTTEQAVQIVTAAWEEDADWGTLVWLVFVTGERRGEVLKHRFADAEFEWHHGCAEPPAAKPKCLCERAMDCPAAYVTCTLVIARDHTKSHRPRRIPLDPETSMVLWEHWVRYVEVMQQLEREPDRDGFMFSYDAAHQRPCDPSGVTHRYDRMCKRLGIDSHLHALRHYTATELIAAGVDLRAVAGRLGHGGGGTTTLRVYAAWLNQADRKPSELLSSRLTRPPSSRPGKPRS
nr:Phage integrase [Kibdelosporangium sp. MJ126-NF4]CTQ94502.1 Phage integrase [Kibdelosporangium sp. MJ126-NF4]